jgi:ATP-dependent helicase/DNAse subunit B
VRDRLAAEALRLLAAPFRGRAPILDPAEALDARVAGALRRALDELAAIADADQALWPAPSVLADALADVEVPAGDRGRRGAVRVTTPLALRARRVRALFLCRVQEGTFPAPPRPDPFLGDAERRALNAASGLRLRLHEEGVDRERYLLYAAVSRPTERLAVSWHAADEDGGPSVPSLFVADVRDVFSEALWDDRGRRALGAVDGPRGRAVERPIAPLRDPEVLAALADRPALSASALEAWASCPVRWFVERHLNPEALEPDAEPLRRGGLAHAVLEEVLRTLCGGGRRLEPDRLPEARAVLDEVLRRHAARRPLSVSPVRARSALRRVEAELWRELERHAHDGGRYVPRHFELGFGGGRDGDAPAVVLAGGRLALQGRIDRVDVSDDGGRAVVVDYKGRSGGAARDRWAQDGHLQVGLYMLALRELLGVEAVGGLYQPVGARDGHPRGLLLDGGDDGLQAKGADRAGREEFDETLRAVEEAALAAAAQLRAGRLEPRPETCGWKGGGCTYPSICRCEAAG